MKNIKLLFITILISIIFMGCGQASKSASIPSENNIKEEKSILGIPEAKRVDTGRNISIMDSISFPLTAFLVLLL